MLPAMMNTPKDNHDESHEVNLPPEKHGQPPDNDEQADDYASNRPAARKAETLVPNLPHANSNLQQVTLRNEFTYDWGSY